MIPGRLPPRRLLVACLLGLLALGVPAFASDLPVDGPDSAANDARLFWEDLARLSVFAVPLLFASGRGVRPEAPASTGTPAHAVLPGPNGLPAAAEPFKALHATTDSHRPHDIVRHPLPARGPPASVGSV
ncbi:MAG: hypothetical protein KF858_15870 [Candidatus Sumerlaeia bacterium]|nr:hypothetical protein [Candidatus Sumerlaeia bacterium]